MAHLSYWALCIQASWPLMTMQDLLCCPLVWLIWAQASQTLMILLCARSTSFQKVHDHNHIQTQQSFVPVVGDHLWLHQQLIERQVIALASLLASWVVWFIARLGTFACCSSWNHCKACFRVFLTNCLCCRSISMWSTSSEPGGTAWRSVDCRQFTLKPVDRPSLSGPAAQDPVHQAWCWARAGGM